MRILDWLFGRRRGKPVSSRQHAAWDDRWSTGRRSEKETPRNAHMLGTRSGSSGCPYKSGERCVVNGKDTGPCSLQPDKRYEDDCFVYRSEKYGPEELFRGLLAFPRK